MLKDDNIQIIFVVSCQKKREKKKKKTRFVLKSQSCNYLNESSEMLLGETFISFGISSSQSNGISVHKCLPWAGDASEHKMNRFDMLIR